MITVSGWWLIGLAGLLTIGAIFGQTDRRPLRSTAFAGLFSVAVICWFIGGITLLGAR